MKERENKMKRVVVTIILLLEFGLVIQGRKIGVFNKGNFKTPILRLDEKQIYIADQGLKKLFIFKRSTLEKINECGGPGEGPGEFSGINQFSIDDKYLYISTFPKLCIFSKGGKLVKEIKLSVVRTMDFKPLGENFVGAQILPYKPADDFLKIRFALYDGSLNKKKDLFITEIHTFVKNYQGKKFFYLIHDCSESFVYKNNIYIGTTEKGFYFTVFDLNGKKMYEIKNDLEKRKVTAEEKERVLKGMRAGMSEEEWNVNKSREELIFREYFPAYKSFFVNDDRIYVFRFPQKGIYEIFILDLKGNLLKKNYLPVMATGRVSSKYNYILNGKLYMTRDNDEELEFHEVDVYPFSLSKNTGDDAKKK
jgi:hypothetical protein